MVSALTSEPKLPVPPGLREPQIHSPFFLAHGRISGSPCCHGHPMLNLWTRDVS